jgi:hypothetical protein
MLVFSGLYSCDEIPDREEMLTKTVYTNTLLVGGAPFEGIRLSLMDGGSTLIPAENLLGFLETPDGSFLLHESEPGFYVDTTSQAFLYHDSEVRFRALGFGFSFEAATLIPQPNNWTSALPEFLEIGNANPSELLFAPQWTPQDGLEYIATLEFLGEPGNPVPFNGEFSTFEESYRLPFTSSGIPLYSGYFSHFGYYRLKIFGVPEAYAELYFSSQLQQSFLAPENIQGGTGIFQGANILEWTFQIVPQ